MSLAPSHRTSVIGDACSSQVARPWCDDKMSQALASMTLESAVNIVGVSKAVEVPRAAVNQVSLLAGRPGECAKAFAPPGNRGARLRWRSQHALAKAGVHCSPAVC